MQLSFEKVWGAETGGVGRFDFSISLLSNDILKSQCPETFLPSAKDQIKDPETETSKEALDL